jgi:energy-coupling factor transporter ATP-binding protein EcfA2
LVPHLTALENVSLPLVLQGFERTVAFKKAREILIKVGLQKQINKIPGKMSGGEQQRVAIARVFIKEPDIILADEPTGQLDQKTAKQILDLLKQLGDKKVVICVTHMTELISHYATRVISLKGGQLTDSSSELRLNDHSIIEESINNKYFLKPIINLAKTNLYRRLKSSLLFLITFTTVLSILLTLSTLGNKMVKNDLLRIFAHNIPINQITIINETETFTESDIIQLEKLENVQSVIPVTLTSLETTFDDPYQDRFNSKTSYVEILPKKQSDFYLNQALSSGEYPKEANEVLITVNHAIQLIGSEKVHSDYENNRISDHDLFDLIKFKTLRVYQYDADKIIIIPLKVVGIINEKSWTYGYINLYFTEELEQQLIETLHSDRHIQEVKVYLDPFDEESRNKTLKQIKDQYMTDHTNNRQVNLAYQDLTSLMNIINGFTITLLVSSLLFLFLMIYYSTSNRQNEIGILKSLGASSKFIRNLFLTELIMILMIAGLISYPFSILLTNGLTKLTGSLYLNHSLTIDQQFVFPNLTISFMIYVMGILIILGYVKE